MHKTLWAILASIALLAAGSVASNAGETSAKPRHKRITHHQTGPHPSSDITSFSSSSAGLHVGVNRPPKNR